MSDTCPSSFCLSNISKTIITTTYHLSSSLLVYPTSKSFISPHSPFPKIPKMPQLAEAYACVPSTERGRGILISGDPKSNKLLYTNGRSVIIMDLNNPLDVAVYAEHAYPATVARFSPNGEWIASADVSGTELGSH